MKNVSTLIMVVLGLGVLFAVGCQNIDQLQTGLAIGNGTSRNMGEVSFHEAFAAAAKAVSSHYSIDPAKTNQANGIIVCRPKNIVNPANERILGGLPARQIAKVLLVSENDQVIAQVLVVQQRQGSGPRQAMSYAQERHNYSGSPGDETPASLSAATTPQQNEAWEFEKTLPNIEGVILTDMFNSLHK